MNHLHSTTEIYLISLCPSFIRQPKLSHLPLCRACTVILNMAKDTPIELAIHGGAMRNGPGSPPEDESRGGSWTQQLDVS